MNPLYNDLLLAHARAPRHAALPAEPTVRARAANPLCGDEIEVGATIVDGRLAALGFHASACAICVASASILCEHLRGRDPAALADGLTTLDAVLRGQPPADDAPVAALASVAAFPSRHGCARLPWQALADALAGAPAPAAPSALTPAPTLDGGDAWAAIAALRASGEAVALATLIATDGSGPCPLGSSMVIGASGRSWGSVSGGCVEPAVIHAATGLLRRGDADASALLRFASGDGQAVSVGLPCGASIHVHVRRAPAPELVARLAAAARPDAAPLVELVPLDGSAPRLVDADALDALEPPLAALARAALARGPQLSEPTPAGYYVAATRSQARLILVGATHIAAKLAQLARVVDLAPIIVDPRAQLAVPERFPGAEIRRDQPGRALAGLLDPRACVVALTHDAKLDDPALEVALASDAVYVAALGSRKTQRARIERLRARGLPERALARLHGPAGLAIGARGPGEIAVSILAELIAAQRKAARAPAIGAVILAAGSSRRAGPRNKLLHPIDGAPMIRRVAEAALAAGFDPCVVVLGDQADQVRAVLAELPLRFVVNEAHAEGMGRSIAAGITALAADHPELEGAAIVLGDMPHVRVADLEALRAAFHASATPRIVAPEAGEGEDRRLGNPILWPRGHFAALAQLQGDRGAQRIVQANPDTVLRVAIEHPGVLLDIDVLK